MARTTSRSFSTRHAFRLALAVAIHGAGQAALAGPPPLPQYKLESRNAATHPADENCSSPYLSGNGRYIAFSSYAGGFEFETTGNDSDIFVIDRKKGVVECVSRRPDGSDLDNNCFGPSMSANGRFVLFLAWDDGTLAPGAAGAGYQAFLHDRKTKTTRRASMTPAGDGVNDWVEFTHLSSDGRYAAFSTEASNVTADSTAGIEQVYLHDFKTGTTELVSRRWNGAPAAGECTVPFVAKGGRKVFFWSTSGSLIPTDTNAAGDVFMHDRKTGQTTRVSYGENGAQLPTGCDAEFAVSDDGKKLGFAAAGAVTSYGNVFDAAYLRTLSTGAIRLASLRPDGVAFGSVYGLALSKNGKKFVFESDSSAAVLDPLQNNGSDRDIFLWRPKQNDALLMTLGEDGMGATQPCNQPHLSGSGKVLVFATNAHNITAPDTPVDSQVMSRKVP